MLQKLNISIHSFLLLLILPLFLLTLIMPVQAQEESEWTSDAPDFLNEMSSSEDP